LSLNLEVQILGEYKNLTKATKGATKQLDGLRKSAQGISRGINTALAAIGIGISFQAITNSISSLTKAAVEDVKAQTLLAQQLRNTVGASDAVVASVEEQIGAVQTATGVVDDQLRPAFAKLVRSTRDTTRAFRLLNLATDISAQTGKSLDSVSQALSRALNGNTASLVKLIPSIRNSTDFVGDLEKQFKGAAAAANNLDPYNRLKIAFDEVRETIGAAFLPALGSIATFIDDNLPKIDALADAINNRVKAAFEGTGTAATNFGTKVVKAITDLTDFLNGTAQADNGFAKFAEGLKPITDLIGAFGEILKGVLAVLDGLFDGLFGWINLFLPAGEQVSGLAGFLSLLGKGLQAIGYWIGYAGSFLVPFTGAFKILGGVLGAFSKTGQAVVNFFKGIGDNIAGFFGGATKRLDDLDKAAKNVPGVSKGIKDIDKALKAQTGYDKASDAVKRLDPALERLKKNFDNNKQGLKELDQAGGLVRSTLGGVAEAIQKIDGKRVTVKVDFRVGGATTGEENRFNNLRKQIADAITEDDDTTTTTTGETTFQKRVKAIVEKLQQTLNDARARIKNASESFRDAVGLSFGVITNGFSARFSTSRVIAQMKRIKDAVKTFSKDIIELRKKGADAALIDELIGLGPLAGSAAARELVTSGSLNEFLGLRKDLASSGAAVGAAGNLAITGTSTSGLQTAINGLNRTIAAGKGNTYNISIANPNITPQQIIAEIKAYEKKTGKKVFSN
jgi:predicted  nucleic acid-binding Zn-ribbon protein